MLKKAADFFKGKKFYAVAVVGLVVGGLQVALNVPEIDNISFLGLQGVDLVVSSFLILSGRSTVQQIIDAKKDAK